ncbi:MAG: heat-inducible transcriptional repressor HrcA, partial [Acidimicrobiia bacterium]
MSHAHSELTTADVDERRAEVLRAIVEEYVASAQPVASQRVVARNGLKVSSATIRNDMHTLERDGYIAQPHTSAGRVPTDLGYRYYVDHLANTARLAGAQQRAVSDFFEAAHSAMEDVLSQTSQLLARITNHAAVVVPPQDEAPTIRGIQLVDIGDGSILVVVVTSTGSVQRISLPVPPQGRFTPDLLARVSVALTASTLGTPIGSLAKWTA